MGLAAAAGLIALGTLTPGPNNLIVLRESGQRGWKAALPAIAGVVVGGLALLGAVTAGAAAVLEREPWLAVGLSVAAAVLLAGLGVLAIAQSLRSRKVANETILGARSPEVPGVWGGGVERGVRRDDDARAKAGMASRATGAVGFTALFLLQFLNPKTWILVVGAVASVAGSATPAAAQAELATLPQLTALTQLAALFVVIPSLSLALWSWAGALAQRHLERRSVRVWTDRITGGLLIGFAVLLLLGARHAG